MVVEVNTDIQIFCKTQWCHTQHTAIVAEPKAKAQGEHRLLLLLNPSDSPAWKMRTIKVTQVSDIDTHNTSSSLARPRGCMAPILHKVYVYTYRYFSICHMRCLSTTQHACPTPNSTTEVTSIAHKHYQQAQARIAHMCTLA